MALNKAVRVTILIFSGLVFLLSSCKKDKDKDDQPSQTLINSPVQFIADFDGSQISLVDMANVNGTTDVYLNGNDHVFGSGFDDTSSSTAHIFSVRKGTMTGTSFKSSEFFNFFHKGLIPLSQDAKDGISISYTDETGTMWSTDYSPNHPSIGTFNVVDLLYKDYLSTASVKLQAEVNVYLYDSTGNAKELKNGKFIGFFEY
jgi:hypothetical protein